jgi:hypothetical protein
MAITKYGKNEAGGHHFGVTVEGMHVLVRSDSAETDERAHKIAKRVENATEDYFEARHIEAEARRKTASLSEMIQRADARAAEARQALEAATTGRRRFFGPVLLVPAIDGDWKGPVWLQDPVKRDRGSALRFASVAEVRAVHPELWIVEMTPHGILLDAAVLPAPLA